jgi:hypothetical protein
MDYETAYTAYWAAACELMAEEAAEPYPPATLEWRDMTVSEAKDDP